MYHKSTDYKSLKAFNRRKVYRDYHEGNVKVSGYPLMLFVESTRFCNLACRMCRDYGEITREQTMEFDLFKKIADQLFPYAEFVDLRGWGESLILKDFEKRARLAAAHGCKLRVLTNLSFVKPHALHLLSELNVYTGVSFDGSTAEVFEHVRRGSRFDRVCKNLKLLVRSYEDAGSDPERICLYVVVHKLNIDQLEHIVELAFDYNIVRVKLNPVSINHESALFIKDYAHVLKGVEAARRRASALGVKLTVGCSLWGVLKRDPLSLSPCIHPWMYCYISYDGRVGFCDHLIGRNGDNYLMGSFYKDSFRSIWNSQKWMTLRAEHLNNRYTDDPMFRNCAWCYRCRFIDFEDSFMESRKQTDVTDDRTWEDLLSLIN